MHQLRKSKSFDCPTCGALAHKPCRMATPLDQLNKDMDPPTRTATTDQDGQGEAYFLEFAILRDLKRLKKLKPDHELVRVVGAYFTYQESVVINAESDRGVVINPDD